MESQKFPELPFRQVHLDFHTSELLERIGENFDKKQFQECLKRGHIESITLFATCHHGWTYYESDVWEMHPNMKTPLLPRMVEAAAEIGVQTPIYLTVGWNERIARLHPEWVVRDRAGNRCDVEISPEGYRERWNRICLNTPYVDQLVQLTEEVMDQFDPVGVFYDITWEKPCFNDACLATKKERGIDLDDESAVNALATEIFTNYHKRVTEVIWSKNPQARVYHNGSDKKGRADLAPYYSHYEVESLPTTSWCGGYEHFPQNARYFKHKGLDYLGMTGKFHESWGEFGGYKHPIALQFETMRNLMFGAKCSIGDQMLPEGLLDGETYRIIGEAYRDVEAKQDWCKNVTNVAEIAVLCPSAVAKDTELEEAEVGASMILSESHELFDMIDEESDFLAYRLIVLPDDVAVNPSLKSKLEAFLARGGSLLASGDSGLNKDAGAFDLDYGLNYQGPSEWYIDFHRVRPEIAEGLVTSPWFNYLPGPKTEVVDAEVLSDTVRPHFNRTLTDFCSHGNTPPGPDAGYPSVAQKGRVIYIGPKVFTMYREKGMRLHRDLVTNCIRRLIPEPMLRSNLPSGATVTLNQKDSGGYVMHILNATPILRGSIPVIEDVTPLSGVEVSLSLASAPSKVLIQPEGELIAHSTGGDERVSFTIPEVGLHTLIEIQ